VTRRTQLHLAVTGHDASCSPASGLAIVHRGGSLFAAKGIAADAMKGGAP
jgi:hypothetical protein